MNDDRALADKFPRGVVTACWEHALGLWDVRVDLAPPERFDRHMRAGADEPLAYIDMNTRRIVVNYGELDRLGAAHSLTAVFAHELGHHIRFPHTLGQQARLELLEKRLIPFVRGSLLNLFFDLQVNEFVGRTHARELCAVYRGFVEHASGPPSSLYLFYLAVYESLWALPAGSLVPLPMVEAMDEKFPGFVADARLFSDTFFSNPDTYLQFVYFCSRFIRYLDDPSDDGAGFPLSGDLPSPDPADYAGGLHGDPQAERALDEAVRRGWLEEDTGKAAGKTDDDKVLTVIDRVTDHRPGTEQAAFREALVAHHYRHIAERYLLRIPQRAPTQPEASLPSITTDWEASDGVQRIDWTHSVLERGPMAAAMPLMRELIIDDATPDGLGVPGVEIYLDTSGSMPRPDVSINAMTLAAQIVALSFLRRGGRVRAIVYSSDYELSDWMYSEDVVLRRLLRFAGAGTNFPFALIEELASQDRDVVRVIISDSDFLHNCRSAARNTDVLAETADRSVLVVAMLAVPKAKAAASAIGRAASHPKFQLVTVSSLQDLAGAAGRLAQSFEDASKGRA